MDALRRPFRAVLVLFVLATLSAGVPAAAQETTATIVGTVTDTSGGVLPGVTVVLKHLGTNRTYERVTSGEGF